MIKDTELKEQLIDRSKVDDSDSVITASANKLRYFQVDSVNSFRQTISGTGKV